MGLAAVEREAAAVVDDEAAVERLLKLGLLRRVRRRLRRRVDPRAHLLGVGHDGRITAVLITIGAK